MFVPRERCFVFGFAGFGGGGGGGGGRGGRCLLGQVGRRKRMGQHIVPIHEQCFRSRLPSTTATTIVVMIGMIVVVHVEKSILHMNAAASCGTMVVGGTHVIWMVVRSTQFSTCVGRRRRMV